MATKYDTVPQRVVDRILSTAVHTEGGCMLFANRLRPDGYGQVGWSDGGGAYVQGRAHRIIWVFTNGPIPEGMSLDHTCHDPSKCAGGPACPHRACVNPSHLRVTTPKGNAANRVSSGPRGGVRLPYCPKGHEFTPENTYLRTNGQRQCRACDRARWHARKVAR